MADTPDKKAHGEKMPEAGKQGASNRLTVTVVSLAALAVLGAATANSLPNSDRFALPNFLPSLDQIALPNLDQLSLPKFDIAWPSFNWTPAPKTNRLAALPPPRIAPPPPPDPAIYAALTDIQFSQAQNTTTLATLTENSATQQADLKRISRQLTTLSAQVNALQSGMAPATTGSIPPSNPRARLIRASRKTTPSAPPLPKPVGPVSVGGAPLTPASAPATAPRTGA